MAQVVADVRREVACEGRKQDAFTGSEPLGTRARPMHRDNRFPRAGTAEHAHWSIPVAFDQPTLGRMEEDASARTAR